MTTKSLSGNIGNLRKLLPSEFIDNRNEALSSLTILGNASLRGSPSDEEKHETLHNSDKDIAVALKPLVVLEDSKKGESSTFSPVNNANRTATENTSNNNNSSNNNESNDAINTKNNSSDNNNYNNVVTTTNNPLSTIALAQANSLSLASTSLRNANYKAPPSRSFSKMKIPPIANNSNNSGCNNSNNNANNITSTSQGIFHPEIVSATAANNASRNITIDELRKYFHLPIADVAKKLGTCTTALKKICRKLNIIKWPYRQILSLTKSIQSLEMASLSDNLEDAIRQQYQEQIALLHKVIGEVLRNPNKTIEHCSLNDLANAVANANGISTVSNKNNNSNVQDTGTKDDKKIATDDNTDDKNDSNDNHDTSNDKQSKLEVKALSLSCSSDTIINIEEEIERTIRRATEFLSAPKVKPSLSQNNNNNNNNNANNASKQANSLLQSKRKYSMSFSSVGETKDTTQQLTTVAALSSPTNKTNGTANDNHIPNNTNVSAHEARSNAVSPASSASSNKMQDGSPSQKESPRHPILQNSTSNYCNGNTSNIQYPNLNIGTSVVKIHYFEDKPNQWMFYGPVQLPPLQRKKFKSLSNNVLTRRNVPLMEPDVGSNTAIDFVPQTLVNAFKKSIAEQSVAAFANNLMMFDPLTGAFTGRLDPSQATNSVNIINNMNNPANNSNNNTNSNLVNMRTSYASQNRSHVYSVSDTTDSNIVNTSTTNNNNSSSFVQPAVHHLHHITHSHPQQQVAVDNTSHPPPPTASHSSSYAHRDSPLSTVHNKKSQTSNKENNNSNGVMYPVSTDMSLEERHFLNHRQHNYPSLRVSYKQHEPVHDLSQTPTGYNHHDTSAVNHTNNTHVIDKEENNGDDLHSLTPSVLTDTIHTAINDPDHQNPNNHRHGVDRGDREEEEEDDDEHGTALALSALLSPLRTPSHHHQHLHAQGYHREPHVFHYADDHLHDRDMIRHHNDNDHDNNDNYLDSTVDNHNHVDCDMDDSRAIKKPRLSSFSAISTDDRNNNTIIGNNHSTNSVVVTEHNHHHNLSHDMSQRQQQQQLDEDDQDEQEEQREMMRHWMDCNYDIDEEVGEEHKGELRGDSRTAELS